jgi:hypothetical protein
LRWSEEFRCLGRNLALYAAAKLTATNSLEQDRFKLIHFDPMQTLRAEARVLRVIL